MKKNINLLLHPQIPWKIIAIALFACLLGFPLRGQNIPVPSNWDVNVNGYKGKLLLQNYNRTTHVVTGKILNYDIQGHISGRHIQFFRKGTQQMYEAWLIDPRLGAKGQPYYDGTLFMTGTVSQSNSNTSGLYPFYAVTAGSGPNNPPPPPPPPTGKWTNMGGFGKDIAVDNQNRPWVIGSNNGIHYHDGTKWIEYPGKGKGGAIATGPGGVPWVIGTNGRIYHAIGSGWKEHPGNGIGRDIAIDGNSRPWVIGTDNRVYYSNGSRWLVHPGNLKAKALSVTSKGVPYIIATDNFVYYGTQNGWQKHAGNATGVDIAIDSQDRPWVIGLKSDIFQFKNGRWTALPNGKAKRLSIARNGVPFVIGLDNHIWRF